eukprot:444766-Ditylum_brightwellii.AAC.1
MGTSTALDGSFTVSLNALRSSLLTRVQLSNIWLLVALGAWRTRRGGLVGDDVCYCCAPTCLFVHGPSDSSNDKLLLICKVGKCLELCNEVGILSCEQLVVCDVTHIGPAHCVATSFQCWVALAVLIIA